MSFMMQAGTINIRSQGRPETRGNDLSRFDRINFPTPFPPGSEVVVIPAVQTFNGSDTPGLRIADVDHRGFRARMNELVAQNRPSSDGNHTTETIAYIAIAVPR
jgi:hypothetical protein